MMTLEGRDMGQHAGLRIIPLLRGVTWNCGTTWRYNELWFVGEPNILMWVKAFHDNLMSPVLTLVRFISQRNARRIYECTAKFRYRQPDSKVTVHVKEPRQRSSAGATARHYTRTGSCLYDGEECLGGGLSDSL